MDRWRSASRMTGRGLTWRRYARPRPDCSSCSASRASCAERFTLRKIRRGHASISPLRNSRERSTMTPQLHAGYFALPSVPDRNLTPPADDLRGMEDKQNAPRVLVVEDDFLIAMQTEIALTAAGFEVIGPATTAEEAVAMAGEAQPTLAVMDIRLASTRDGIDAARQLYQDFAIRCIFATAHDDAHTRGRAEPYAPLGWLPKPYTMASLVAVVADAVAELRRR